ncbi:MAG: hypothetical protein A3I63_10835 [Betaproteobacteria bacterium RIFCSPLOWO2_02_FULL_66_14]|nr:MAG: hypothetical protein A3I63_10835 [Betaproteobacteria bacterium RIFCSPLOWO2_02_FULL_66_14]
MKQQIIKWWESRSPRDRVVIAALGALVAVVLYFVLIQSAYRARTQLGASVATLRAQALRLERDAAELARVRAVRVPPVAQTDLRTHVQALITGAGLSGGLLRIDATDANHVQVVFGSVAFAEWLQWVTVLQSQQIRLETGRVEALSTPGMVGSSATFSRARAQ